MDVCEEQTCETCRKRTKTIDVGSSHGTSLVPVPGIWLPQHRSDDTTSTTAGNFVSCEHTCL